MKAYVLIKGDISGIQEFIFNIQSKGAAKSLKVRSFFIEALGYLAERRVHEVFPNARRVYIGGGNFYLKLALDDWDEEKFQQLRQELHTALPYNGIAITLSALQCEDPAKSYGDYVQELNKVSSRVKMQPFAGLQDPGALFEPFTEYRSGSDSGFRFDPRSQDLFRKFTSKYVRSARAILIPSPETRPVLSADRISLFGHSVLLQAEEDALQNGEILPIDRHLPLWTGELLDAASGLIEDREENEGEDFEKPWERMIVEFGYLAGFAKMRTGTEKMGVLKLDVDNLGALFQAVGDELHNQRLSEKMKAFFSEELGRLLDGSFTSRTRISEDGETIKEHVRYQQIRKGRSEWVSENIDVHACESREIPFRDNLYIVFAGGDDSFIIGAWDAVIHFAVKLRSAFAEFDVRIRKQIPSLKAPITLSAAILILDEHFPVVKFAEIAEDQLHLAKTAGQNSGEVDASGKPMKNQVAFLGRVFSWVEFEKVMSLTMTFEDMVLKYGAPKAVLQRIIYAYDHLDSERWVRNGKAFHPALLWRFLYSFRDIRKKPWFRAHFYEKFFGREGQSLSREKGTIYREHILEPFVENNPLSQALPVAARWAEFLTRKKSEI